MHDPSCKGDGIAMEVGQRIQAAMAMVHGLMMVNGDW